MNMVMIYLVAMCGLTPNSGLARGLQPADTPHTTTSFMTPNPPLRNIRQLVNDLKTLDTAAFDLASNRPDGSFSAALNDKNRKARPHSMSCMAVWNLIELGPRALPVLLESLSDSTQTSMVVHIEPGQAVFFLADICSNPFSPIEQTSLRQIKDPQVPGLSPSFNTVDRYAITVGDVCFSLIGQIVGRYYQVVQEYPTNAFLVTSPTHDSIVARKVRSIWSSSDPSRRLFDCLMRDYSSRTPRRDLPLDNWYEASDYQISSVQRLLYYFPEKTSDTVARRLRGLDVHSVGVSVNEEATEKQLKRWVRRETANQVRTDGFVKAVAWCRIPAVRMALRRILRRTDDNDIVEAARGAAD